jgi:hypothetical protein
MYVLCVNEIAFVGNETHHWGIQDLRGSLVSVSRAVNGLLLRLMREEMSAFWSFRDGIFNQKDLKYSSLHLYMFVERIKRTIDIQTNCKLSFFIFFKDEYHTRKFVCLSQKVSNFMIMIKRSVLSFFGFFTFFCC